MAATQRPITEAALNEASTDPAWKAFPSLLCFGDKDKTFRLRLLRSWLPERMPKRRLL
jgi:hypothetical protein